MKFRSLRADEIECKIKSINTRSIMLLLYKDARVDQRMLDEVVGAENWQRSHEVINGNLYCNVGIRIERDHGFGEWVWKQDVGTESYTEAEKGQASDAFKRACFNWGIGRELYTSPQIWVSVNDCNVKDGKCYDKFVCTHLVVEAGRITELEIYNNNTRKQVFAYKEKRDSIAVAVDVDKQKIKPADIKAIKVEIAKRQCTENGVLQRYHITSFEEMTFGMFRDAMHGLEKTPLKEK